MKQLQKLQKDFCGFIIRPYIRMMPAARKQSSAYRSKKLPDIGCSSARTNSMAKTELIDSQVSVKQCTRAIQALHAYASKKQKEQEENELLPANELYVWLQIAVKRMHPEKKIKPFRM